MKTCRLTSKGLQAALVYVGLGLISVQADIGVVTVDGEPVPRILFEGYAHRFQTRFCPPLSDERVREEVVMAWLLVREGKRRGITLEGVDALSTERFIPKSSSDCRITSRTPGVLVPAGSWKNDLPVVIATS